jgi:hypothetical protein
MTYVFPAKKIALENVLSSQSGKICYYGYCSYCCHRYSDSSAGGATAVPSSEIRAPITLMLPIVGY